MSTAYFSLDALSVEEKQELVWITDALKDNASEQAAAVRAEYVKTMAAQGHTIAATEGEDGVINLGPEQVIKLADVTRVTCGDINENPKKYDGVLCGDPLEPEYGDGRVAKIFAGAGQHSGPVIHSFAHGGRTFALNRGGPVPAAEDDFEALDPAPALDPPTSQEETPPWVKKLNKKFALVIEQAGVVLSLEDGGLIPTAHWKNIVSLPAAVSAHWLRHLQRLMVRRRIMDPTKAPGIVLNGSRLPDYNLWNGFAQAPSTEGSCDLYLDHLRTIICAGDPKIYEWVIQWIAAMFQNPARLAGTALALRGVQGAGKDIVGEVLGTILGLAHYIRLSNAEGVTGSFNKHLEGRVLAQLEEAFFAGDKRHVGLVKALITSPRLNINPKYIEPYTVENLLHLLITSNEVWVVPAERGERRFTVLDVSKARANDFGYFAALRQQMFNEGGCARLLHHLLYEVTVDYQLISRPLATKALFSQQEQGFSRVMRWAMECARTGRLPGGGSTPLTEDVISAVGASVRNHSEANRDTPTSIGEFLAPLGVENDRIMKQGTRRRYYAFPPLTEFRARLASDLRFTPDWDLSVTEWETEAASLLEALQ